MYKQFLMIVTALALFGLTTGQASANSVGFAEPNPIETGGASTLTLNIVATSFTDTVDAGSFNFTWDPGVLAFTGGTITYPNADPFFSFFDDTNAATGVVEVFVGSLVSATGNFDIATINFNVVGGTGTTINFNESCLGCGWFGGGSQVPFVVDYTPGQVAVAAVPVPAAVWLMGSGLLGLVGIGRRTRS